MKININLSHVLLFFYSILVAGSYLPVNAPTVFSAAKWATTIIVSIYCLLQILNLGILLSSLEILRRNLKAISKPRPEKKNHSLPQFIDAITLILLLLGDRYEELGLPLLMLLSFKIILFVFIRRVYKTL